jgi:hypothetical protein
MPQGFSPGILPAFQPGRQTSWMGLPSLPQERGGDGHSQDPSAKMKYIYIYIMLSHIIIRRS